MVPSWLSEGDGGLVLESLAGIKDAFTERMLLGLEARFPSRAGESALALLGSDRGILRGRTETQAHYAARLLSWRYPRGHRTRGSAFALLEQVSEYFGGIRAWTIDYSGNREERAADGTETFEQGYAWNWDSAVTTVYRFWLVLDPVPQNPAIEPWPAVLGAYDNSLIPGRGFTVGHQGVTHEDALAIKKLFRGSRQWKPAGTAQQFAVIGFDAAAPVPDGAWGNNQGRDRAFRYWSLQT
jgi:hypothetical protein